MFEDVVKNLHDTDRHYFCLDSDSTSDEVISLKHFLGTALVGESPSCNVSLADTML